MKYRFRLWHVGVFVALAASLAIGLAAVLWPRPEYGLLSPQNVDKANAFRTQAEFEQLFGPPNSTPKELEKSYSYLVGNSARILAWEDTVSEHGDIYIRRLEIAFNPTTGEKFASFYIGCGPTFWDEVSGWLTDWLP
jgi:hypothetical protein